MMYISFFKTFQRFSGDKTFKDFEIYIRFVSAPLKHPKTNKKTNCTNSVVFMQQTEFGKKSLIDSCTVWYKSQYDPKLSLLNTSNIIIVSPFGYKVSSWV